CARGVNFDSW
nr:immunoglobulin heavy chain junction region [Mus musculus]